MGEAIGAVLGPAIGVALSPLPIVAVILMLFSERARTNGPAFVGGWVVGLVVVVGIVLVFADPADLGDTEDDPSTVSGVIHIVLGIGLLLLAVRQWRGRPGEGETPEPPKWMQSIDNVAPLAAFGLGAFMSGLNPKNLIFDVAAGTSIAQANLSTAESIVPALVFVVLASISVAGPVIWYLVSPERAAKSLDVWKDWLQRNNATVMSVLLLVLGVSQIGKGIPALWD